MHSTSRVASTLPPESTAHTSSEPSTSTLPASSAATDAAPAPSTTSFERSSSSTIASATSSSETVTILSSIAGEQRRGDLAGPLDRDPVADRPLDAALRLHADDAHAVKPRTRRDRDPGRERSAADRDHDHRRRRRLVRDLEPDRALSGDHVGVVEGVDQRCAGALGVLARGLCGVVVRTVDECHLAAVGANRLDLRQRRVTGHEQVGAGVAAAGGERNGLGVVAGARGDDPAPELGVGEAADPVLGAADLERAAALQVLGLQRHRGAAAARDLTRRDHRRAPHAVAERRRRCLDPIDADADRSLGPAKVCRLGRDGLSLVRMLRRVAGRARDRRGASRSAASSSRAGSRGTRARRSASSPRWGSRGSRR